MGINGLSIKTKILLIPTIGTISFVIYLVLATVTALGNSSLLEGAQKVQFPLVQLASKLASDIEKIEATFNTAVTTGDEDQLALAKQLHTQVQNDLSEMKVISPESSGKLSEISTVFERFYAQGEELATGMVTQTMDFSKMPIIAGEMNENLEILKKDVAAFYEARNAEFENSINQANADSAQLVTIGIGMGLVTIALLFVTAIPVVKGIHHSLSNVITSLKDIAEGDGDLTVRLKTRNVDEIGELVAGFNGFLEKLQGTIRDIVHISQPLSSTAAKVKGSADETQVTTGEQKKSVEDTIQSVTEMNSAVQNIANSASQTADSVKNASSLTKDGALVVDETIVSINKLASKIIEAADVVFKLEKDVEKVGDVLQVIKNIAEQTNLLALNAAIEAARAGEQGRGFAVVADEVRTLASRTQASTEEIQATIENLQSASRSAVATMNTGSGMVQSSVEKATMAGESLTSLEQTIESINSMTMRIAAATEQQTVMANTIVGSVEGIGSTSEATNHTASDLAQVSNELADMAGRLQLLTSGFKA